VSGTPHAIQPGAHGAHGAIEEHPVFVQHKHPNYVLIFVILFIFTALEVWVTTPIAGIEFPLPVLTVPTLLVLAILKFATIAAFYMHLRYDSRAFSALFIVGLLLAVGMLFTLQALFTAHHRLPFDATAAREAGTLPPAAGEQAATPTAGASGANTTTAGTASTGTTTSTGTGR
jgi:cytochrome c oxidase subunit 4